MGLIFFWSISGDVVTVECVEKIIKKDWIHPLTNEKLKESDIIYLERVCNFFFLFHQTNFFKTREVLDILQRTSNWKQNTRGLFFKFNGGYYFFCPVLQLVQVLKTGE